jgi:hypothetical protein
VALAPSRTTLAQEGARLESKGSEPAGRVVHCCVPPPLLSLPSTPVKGEAGRWGRGRSGVAPACLLTPSTPGGGEALGRGVVWRAGPVDRPVPSTWGEGAGSMGGQAGPSQRES